MIRDNIPEGRAGQFQGVRIIGQVFVPGLIGNPGTGKTTTLVEAIYETLMRENQVLVCAQSNMAVDCY